MMQGMQPQSVVRATEHSRPWWPPRRIAIVVLAAVLSVLAMRAFNPYTGTPPHIDSGVYLGVAEHLLHGRILYREVWDHKPPLVHVIDALALAAGDHTVNSVRTMERWWAAIAALAMLAIALVAFDNLAVAGLASLLFVVHFYHPNIMRGNQPEEYGSILTLLGIALCLASLTPLTRRSASLAAASGLLFGLACLAKETFVLGVPPWLALLVWDARHDRRLAVRRTLLFLAALLIPPLTFLAYLLWNGAVGDWWDVIRFNLSYIRFDASNEANPGFPGLLADGFRRANELVFGVSRVTAAAALLGCASAASASFRRRTNALPVVLVAFFLFNLASVSLARRYGYYYLQLVPAYVLLAAFGVAFLAFLARTRRGLGAALIALVALGLVAADTREAARFACAVSHPRALFQADHDLVSFIDASTAPADPIWNLVRDGSAVYAHADRLSPTRFIYLGVNLFRDLPHPEAARDEIRTALAARPPKIILFDGDASWLAKAGLEEWFRTNYQPGPLAMVFVRKPAVPPGDDAR
jgi:hypothetical protein